MNLFILSPCPRQCAQWMFDLHVVKILLEAVQLLCTARRLLEPGGELTDILYKPTHINHPVSQWVRSSYPNYQWTMELCDALHCEWIYRFGHDQNRVHKAYAKTLLLRATPPTLSMFEFDVLTPFAQAMPEQYKHLDPIQAYRQYYMSPDKQRLASWRGREQPHWFIPDPLYFGIRNKRPRSNSIDGPNDVSDTNSEEPDNLLDQNVAKIAENVNGVKIEPADSSKKNVKGTDDVKTSIKAVADESKRTVRTSLRNKKTVETVGDDFNKTVQTIVRGKRTIKAVDEAKKTVRTSLRSKKSVEAVGEDFKKTVKTSVKGKTIIKAADEVKKTVRASVRGKRTVQVVDDDKSTFKASFIGKKSVKMAGDDKKVAVDDVKITAKTSNSG